MTLVRLSTRGSGPHVLFLHGTPTPWDVLAPIADACANRTVHVAAMPGYGSAAAPPASQSWSLDDQLAAIELALASAGVKETAVVGFSGGSYRALQLAIRGRVAVRSIVTLGGIEDLSAEERAGFSGFSAALRQGASFAGVATARFLSPAFAAGHPEACAHVERWLDAVDRETLARELDAFAVAPSLVDGVRTLAIPIVARVGELDVATPLAHSKAIVDAAKHGTLQVVKSAGHALLEEDAAATIAAVCAVV